ncbi:MAG: L-threonylcarbamoyladenylate synthase [Actinomycetota bacterium]|nr:L-threonylcarbamoyladenylate synthase [Actinomycetota bacterium]
MTSDPIAQAAAAARGGELIVVPTDTVYGIGTRPDDALATARIFEAKERSRDLELPVLGAGVDALRGVAIFDELAERLAEEYWPGALTLVLPRAVKSREWQLGGTQTTVGVRIPRHPLALAVLAATGPLAVSSANRSGRPPAETCEELERTFGTLVAVYLCEEGPLVGQPSTVLDLANGEPRVLRPGAINLSLLDSRPSPGE